MNMKRKIRRAFKNATPQVLHRISPAPAKVIAMPEAREKAERAPKEKMKLRELVATAAVVALIIGSLASGIQFIGQHIQSGSAGGTSPTEPTDPILQPSDFVDGYIKEAAALRIAFSQIEDNLHMIGTNFAWHLEGILLSDYNGTIPCYWVTYVRHPEGDFANYEYQTAYIDATNGQVLDVQNYATIDQGMANYGDKDFQGIWNLILEDDNALTSAAKLSLSDSFSVVRSGELYHVDKMSYQGFDYTFVTAPGGKFEFIDVAVRENREDGQYISKDVALEIVCLERNIDLADGTSAYVTQEGEQYQVMIYGEVIIAYLVDATTGEMAYLTITDENPLVQLRDIALAFHGISLEQCISIINSPMSEGTFIFYTDTDRYEATVDITSREVTSHKTYHYDNGMLESRGWDYEAYIPYLDALNRAVAFLGYTLDDVIELAFNIDTEMDTVSFSLKFGAVKRNCKVDLLTGQVSHNAKTDMETIAMLRNTALAYFNTTSVGLPMDECWYINTNINRDTDCIIFTFYYGTDKYGISVSMSDATITRDSSISTGYLAEFIENPPAVGWQKARDIALNALGLKLNDVSQLFIDYDSENLIYNFTIESYPQPYTCSVSASTGEVIEQITLEDWDEVVS